MGRSTSRTVEYTHSVLRKALADAVRQGVLATNPFVDPCLPRHDPDADEVADDEQSIWDGEQLRTFLELVADDPLYDLWLLAATTGMRRGGDARSALGGR